MIPAPPVLMTYPADSLPAHSSLLLPFLFVDSWIIFEHKGAYHKGFLTRKPCGTYRFSFKTHVQKKSEDWGVNIPNQLFSWADLCTKGVLIPGHVVHTFIHPATSLVFLVSALPTLTFDPVASIVSAINLHCDFALLPSFRL